MRIRSFLSLPVIVLAAACGAPDMTQPDVDQLLVTTEDKPQEVACAPKKLKKVQKGTIKTDDCLFGTDQREDLYRVDQLKLGQPDLSGATMLTFTPEADFPAIYGLSNWDETQFGTPVYGFNTVPRDPVAVETTSYIGSAAEFKLFFGSQPGVAPAPDAPASGPGKSGNSAKGGKPIKIGNYTLTTTVEPSASTCQVGHRVFLQGNVSFSSSINDDNACDGFIGAGPFYDPDNPIPLKYQFWQAKLIAGQEVTVTVEGVDPSQTTVALAGGRFGTSFFFIDFDDGTGTDTDRTLTFTAPSEAYYYFEVSGLPGVDTPYTLTFTSN